MNKFIAGEILKIKTFKAYEGLWLSTLGIENHIPSYQCYSDFEFSNIPLLIGTYVLCVEDALKNEAFIKILYKNKVVKAAEYCLEKNKFKI